MRIVRLCAEALAPEQLAQMYAMELNCGLEPYTPEMLLECITRFDTFACMDGANIVGFLTMHSHGGYLGGSLYVVNVNVAQCCRNHGIAKWLFAEAYRHYLPQHGEKMVTLDVAKTNTARKLYQRLGFEELPIPSRNGEDHVVMAVPLREMGRKLQKLGVFVKE